MSLRHAKSLDGIPWLVHGFTTRAGGFSKVYGGGALNLGFTATDSRAAVERNRRAVIAASMPKQKRKSSTAARGKLWPLVTLRQIHSDIVHCIDEVPKALLSGDGLITSAPGILLGVLAADCLPVILVDPKHHAIGVFHAGWRGTAKRIVEKGVGEMRRYFRSDPSELRAAIGPGIGSCCYTVGQEVREIFEAQFEYAKSLFREVKESDEVRDKYPLLFLTARAPGHSELPTKIFLDLAEANRRQLIAAGLKARNISDLSLCTSCHVDLLFSHRAENGNTGRMMAIAGIGG